MSTDGNVPFLWLRLFQTGEGHVCEERILSEGQIIRTRTSRLQTAYFDAWEKAVCHVTLCLPVSGAGLQVALHPPVPLVAADHCP